VFGVILYLFIEKIIKKLQPDAAAQGIDQKIKINKRMWKVSAM